LVALREIRLLRDSDLFVRFEQVVLPHLGAAYNLARWLTHNDHDAEDVVQEAYLRAFKFFPKFHGTGGKAWLLAIVRNTCYTWLERNRPPVGTAVFDEEKHSPAAPSSDVGAALLRGEQRDVLWRALAGLSAPLREAIVLRELEQLSYKEIADIAGVPLGTVMSRLARAREQLEQELLRRRTEEL
jgi:RNA polymerase sigma-70 factor (ECF subfamily)